MRFREKLRFTDVIVKSSDGVQFYFYGIYLVTASNYFEQLLTANWKENESNIINIDYDEDITEQLLMWIYDKKIPESVKTFDQKIELMYAADQYGLVLLIDAISKTFKNENLTIEELNQLVEFPHTLYFITKYSLWRSIISKNEFKEIYKLHYKLYASLLIYDSDVFSDNLLIWINNNKKNVEKVLNDELLSDIAFVITHKQIIFDAIKLIEHNENNYGFIINFYESFVKILLN